MPAAPVLRGQPRTYVERLLIQGSSALSVLTALYVTLYAAASGPLLLLVRRGAQGTAVSANDSDRDVAQSALSLTGLALQCCAEALCRALLAREARLRQILKKQCLRLPRELVLAYVLRR